MDEKKQLTAEEELRETVKPSGPGPKTVEEYHNQSDRVIDLIIDLIAERSEEKAEEMIENHKIDYDHDLLYGR